MFDSLTQETSYSIVEKEVHKLVFGTSDPKAPFHVHGTSRMEARNPLLDPMPEEVEEQIADAVKRHLTGIS